MNRVDEKRLREPDRHRCKMAVEPVQDAATQPLVSSLVNTPVSDNSSDMVDCSDWEQLNAKFRIATVRFSRFMALMTGTFITANDETEAKRLEGELNEARHNFLKHEDEHGCRG